MPTALLPAGTSSFPESFQARRAPGGQLVLARTYPAHLVAAATMPQARTERLAPGKRHASALSETSPWQSHPTGWGGGSGSAWAVPRAMELQHSLSLRLLWVVLPRLLGQLFQQPHSWAGQHEAVNPCPALSQMGSAEPCLPPSTLPAAPDGPSSLALAG